MTHHLYNFFEMLTCKVIWTKNCFYSYNILSEFENLVRDFFLFENLSRSYYIVLKFIFSIWLEPFLFLFSSCRKVLCVYVEKASRGKLFFRHTYVYNILTFIVYIYR